MYSTLLSTLYYPRGYYLTATKGSVDWLKKPFKAPACVNSSICFYNSMSQASAGLVYMHLRARLHGITSLNITIFSHLSANLEPNTISHKIEAATSCVTIPTTFPQMLVSVTLQKALPGILLKQPMKLI
jgi:uncharacterized membrane protein